MPAGIIGRSGFRQQTSKQNSSDIYLDLCKSPASDSFGLILSRVLCVLRLGLFFRRLSQQSNLQTAVGLQLWTWSRNTSCSAWSRPRRYSTVLNNVLQRPSLSLMSLFFVLKDRNYSTLAMLTGARVREIARVLASASTIIRRGRASL